MKRRKKKDEVNLTSSKSSMLSMLGKKMTLLMLTASRTVSQTMSNVVWQRIDVRACDSQAKPRPRQENKARGTDIRTTWQGGVQTTLTRGKQGSGPLDGFRVLHRDVTLYLYLQFGLSGTCSSSSLVPSLLPFVLFPSTHSANINMTDHIECTRSAFHPRSLYPSTANRVNSFKSPQPGSRPSRRAMEPPPHTPD